MINRNKANKKTSLSRIITIFLLLSICVIFITNPSFYASSCLNAISVWVLNVLPVMFPFFIFTRLIVNLISLKPNRMDKFFSKAYHTPSPSFFIYFLSILSGYPMGAKLICTLFDTDAIDRTDANRMLSFCSVSGPMFIVGTVGVAFLKNYFAGIIILISNIIGSLLNGLLYRGKSNNNIYTPKFVERKNTNILSDSVYDSLISILMVGAYIVLSFLLIDILKNIKIFEFVTNTICWVFNLNNSHDIVQSTIIGCFEMTRGILELSHTNCSIQIMTIISSALISFGGISVMMQSISFLNKLNLPIKNMFKQKFTQSILTLIIAIILSSLFL